MRELKFKLRDQVRIGKSQRTFRKVYLPSWTQEIVTVTKIILRVPPVYQLQDYVDDEIEGVFYAKELQKVQKSDDIYKIEKILAEKKGNGKGACNLDTTKNSTSGYLNQSYKSYKYSLRKR